MCRLKATIFFVVALLTITTCVKPASSIGNNSIFPVCPQCPGGDCPQPIDCKFGTAVNYCGFKICAKGPGDLCGNQYYDAYGICGIGTFCRCDRCIGCSLATFECYDKMCFE